MASRKSQVERSEEAQLRLLEATTQLLKDRGYAGLRMAGAAEAAGMSRGGLLHHFTTKDDLVLATAAHILRQSRIDAMKVVEHTWKHTTSLDELYENVVTDARKFFFSEEFGVMVDLLIMAGKNPVFKKKIHEYAIQERMPVENAWLELMVDRGIPAEKAEMLLSITLTLMRGLFVRALWAPDEEQFDEMLFTWRELAKKYIGLEAAWEKPA